MNRFFGGVRTVIILLGLMLGPPAVVAGGFQVSPVLARIQPGDKVATFTLANPSADSVTVQVDVLAWQQNLQGEHFAPATNVLVAPRVVTLPPKEERLVRVALRIVPTRESTFRVHFREVPPPAEPGFVGVRTLINQNIPLVFLVDGSADPAWRLTVADQGQLVLSGANKGARYFRSGPVEISDSRGALLGRLESSLHLLAESKAQWPLVTHGQPKWGESVRLRFPSDPDLAEVPLVIE